MSECPTKGDIYTCPKCDFTIVVVKDCTCPEGWEDCGKLECCNEPMEKAN